MGIFDSIFSDGIYAFTPTQFFLTILSGLFVGLLVALFSSYRSNYTKGYLITIALLPMVVSVIVVTVNDNIGMGLAIAGAFSLMKFRSIPGKSMEMLYLCLALAAGLLNGTGYLGYAIIFAMATGIVTIVYDKLKLGVPEKEILRLRITVPEDLSYYHAFDSILDKYTSEYTLVKSRTDNLGSVYVIFFDVAMKDKSDDKDMISEILQVNDNMDVYLKQIPEADEGL